MQAVRKSRLEKLIHQELSLAVPRIVKDPRVGWVTVTQARLSDDGRSVRAHVTLLGGAPDAESMEACLEGLNSAAGLLKHHLGKVLRLRRIPSVRFYEDKGLEHSFKIDRILKDISEEAKN